MVFVLRIGIATTRFFSDGNKKQREGEITFTEIVVSTLLVKSQISIEK